MELREYQSAAVAKIRSVLAGGSKRVVMVMPTGGGKSATLGEIARLTVAKGGRVLFLVHRRNLVTQMRDNLRRFGIEAGVIMAGHESQLYLPVQVGTHQTFGRRVNLPGELFKVDADVLMWDECHRSISKTAKEIIDLYDGKVIIGVTATPARSDGRGLGEVYEALVDTVTVGELTEGGFLSPVRYYAAPSLDLAEVKVVRGDYEIDALEKKVNTPKLIGDVVENWLRLAQGRKTIVFATSVKHSKSLSEEFLRNGVSAQHLDAKSSEEERESAFLRMERGELTVLCNVALYQEGMDCPDIGCVVMARPTKSMGLWRQCGGRGLRPSPGKTDLILLDHGGVIEEHGRLDEVVEWQLSGKERAWKEPAKKDKKERQDVICSVCARLFRGEVECPDCGNPVRVFGKKVEVIEADLEEVGKKTVTMADKRRWYGMLKSYALRKGYKSGWIAHKYRDKFHVWPIGMKEVDPIEPNADLYNWIKYCAIRAAKGAAKNA